MGKYVNQLYVLDFLGVLSAITQMQFIKLHRGERGLEGIHFERTCPHHVHLRSGGPEYLISKTISKREAVII